MLAIGQPRSHFFNPQKLKDVFTNVLKYRHHNCFIIRGFPNKLYNSFFDYLPKDSQTLSFFSESLVEFLFQSNDEKSLEFYVTGGDYIGCSDLENKKIYPFNLANSFSSKIREYLSSMVFGYFSDNFIIDEYHCAKIGTDIWAFEDLTFCKPFLDEVYSVYSIFFEKMNFGFHFIIFLSVA